MFLLIVFEIRYIDGIWGLLGLSKVLLPSQSVMAKYVERTGQLQKCMVLT